MRVLAIVGMLVAVAEGGCGGGGQPTHVAAAQTPRIASAALVHPAPTHATFVSRLNSTCREANKGLGRASAAFDADIEKGDTRAAARRLEAAADRNQPFLHRVMALEPPSPDRAAFQRYLLAVTRNQSIGRRFVAAIRSGDTDEESVLIDLVNVEQKRRLLAAVDLGAEDCGG